MTPNLQLKLLRVLQEQQFERVGGEETVQVDVRVVSATHRDLKKAVDEGNFREDLFYRLHVIPFRVPSLRERREDIPLLASHFIKKLGPRANPQVHRIDESALARLSAYAWPGNVRELENAIEQSLVFANGDSIDLAALPGFLREGASESTLALPGDNMSLPGDPRRSRAPAHPARLRSHGRGEDRNRAPTRHQDQCALLQARKVRHRHHRRPPQRWSESVNQET